MAKKPRQSAGIYVSRGLLQSRAFLSLRGKAPQVLLLFFTKRRVQRLRRPDARGNRFEVVNNGEIVFTYREARRRYGIGKSAFTRAIDALVRRGFISVTHAGGGLKGDCSKYAISDRWRKWGTAEFERAERPAGRPWAILPTPENGRGS